MRSRLRRIPHATTCLLAVATLVAAVAGGCSATPPRRDPTGERLPTVLGADLNEKPVTLPDDLAGAPALLLVGYKQMSQFDIDRWLLGIEQAKLGVKAVEVPTIAGLVPGLFANQIDEAMRTGIPENLYAIVVTVYGDEAEKIEAFTGKENALPARVMLLDADGRVVYFYDAGYSIDALMRLKVALDTLRGG